MQIENQEPDDSGEEEPSNVECESFDSKKKSLTDIKLFLQHTALRVLREDVNLRNPDLYSFLDGLSNYLDAHPERFTSEMGPWDFVYESIVGGLDYE